MEWITIAQMIIPFITGGLMWQVWNLRAALVKISSDAAAASKNAGEAHSEAQRLREEHADIQKQLEKISESQVRESATVGTAINDLQKEHSSHNEVQAKILQLCEILERRGK